MVGSHITNQPDYKELLKEAKENIGSGNPTKLLSKMVEDYMYMSSETYYNWFHENSNIDNLPLTFSGSLEEEHYLQLELLKEKALSCKSFEYKIIENTGHTYRSKELEIANLISDWVEACKS